MSFAASVLTLYPEMFPGPLGLSLAGRALEAGTWSLDAIQIRDFATDRHRTVDDTPAGGGAGMVMRADVLATAIDHASPAGDVRPRLLMSPRGEPLTQRRVRELASGPGAIIVCGRFEGVDQRLIESRGLEEMSIGDFILSGGEPAALVLLDAVVRLLPGVMGNAVSGMEESFENGVLEHPQYTRPQEFEGREIPDVLVSGNHKKIMHWRRGEAEKLTVERRPDLLTVVDYDPSTKVLSVRFAPSGTQYDYEGVELETFAKFNAAFSKGRFFTEFIRDHYKYRRVGH
ncbi:tRNA (guanosine(37)-N1)-methyltransferase TrmD [Mesorhizobium sp. B2-3-5]|nr:tRNA (guanosine(37)-N1)-methyltransferase TrmD [Mesorhizobium sp. B2-3-5]